MCVRVSVEDALEQLLLQRKERDSSPSPARSVRRRVADTSRDVAATRSPVVDLEAPTVFRRPSNGVHTQEPSLNKRDETCAICAEERGAFQAVRLPCGHGWYCAACIASFAEARLQQGLHDVPCPECHVPLCEALLRAVLPPSSGLMERLLVRSLEQAVDSSGGLWACPTPDCPNRVALDEGQEPRLQCQLCGKEHCLRCQAHPYHTGRTCEEHAAAAAADARSAAASASSSSGVRAPASDAVRRLEEERGLREWMARTGSRQCPTCRMGVTKEDLSKQNTQASECHKMICRNCKTRFCFKCLAVLTASFSCGCTRDDHGFVDPRTGQFVQHLRPTPQPRQQPVTPGRPRTPRAQPPRRR